MHTEKYGITGNGTIQKFMITLNPLKKILLTS